MCQSHIGRWPRDLWAREEKEWLGGLRWGNGYLQVLFLSLPQATLERGVPGYPGIVQQVDESMCCFRPSGNG
eukprot:1033040-Rhodomonas_salina.1